MRHGLTFRNKRRDDILFKLNRVIIVKLSREIRVNLGQNIAYELTLSNKRLAKYILKSGNNNKIIIII